MSMLPLMQPNATLQASEQVKAVGTATLAHSARSLSLCALLLLLRCAAGVRVETLAGGGGAYHAPVTPTHAPAATHTSTAAATAAAAAARPAPLDESASSIAAPATAKPIVPALSLAPLLAAAAAAVSSGTPISASAGALPDRTELITGGSFGALGFVDGVGARARFSSPAQMALQRDATGAAVAVVISDRDNHALRRLHLQSGRVETLACRPQMRPTNADTAAAAASASATTAAAALPLLLPLSSPAGVLLDPQSTGSWLLLADGGNHLIRKLWLPVEASAGGSGAGAGASLSALPRAALWAGGQGGALGWENEGDDEVIPTSADEAQPSTVAASALPAERPMTARRRMANRMAEEQAAAAAVATGGATVPPVIAASGTPSAHSAPFPVPASALHTVPASSARFSRPSGLCWDASSNVLLCDRGNKKLKKISATGLVSQVLPGRPGEDHASAYDAAAASASAARQLYGPECVAIDSRNNVLIADTAAHCILRLAPSGACTVLAGVARTPGFRDAPPAGTGGAAALFSSPRGLAVDPRSQCVFVADSDNHAIRLVTPQGAVVTIAGQGAPCLVLALPGASAADAGAADSARRSSARPSSASTFRSYSNRAPPAPTSGGPSTAPLGAEPGAQPEIEHEPEEGFVDGVSGHARFFRPEGLVFDEASDALYVCDSGNNSVRRLRIERGGVSDQDHPAAGASAAAVAGFGALVPSEPFPSARLMSGDHHHPPASPSRGGDTQLNRHASMPSFRSPLTARPATATAAAARPGSSDSVARRWGGGGGGGGGGSGAGASPPSLDAPPLPTDPHSWSRIDVAFWLLSLSPAFEAYVPAFHTSRIDGPALLSKVQGRAGDAVLQQVGVGSKMHRNAILRAVLRLANPGEDEQEQADSGSDDGAALDQSGDGSARGSGPNSRVGSASATRPVSVGVRPMTAGGWRPSSASVSSRASAAAESLLSAMHLSDPPTVAAPTSTASAAAELAQKEHDLLSASD